MPLEKVPCALPLSQQTNDFQLIRLSFHVLQVRNVLLVFVPFSGSGLSPHVRTEVELSAHHS